MAEVKVCTRCDETKPLESFGPHKTGKFGRDSRCKPCNALRRKEYKLANRDKERAAKARYRAKHADRERARKANSRGEWNARRRARARGAAHFPYDRARVFERWGHMCCYCDAPAEHLDHVRPLSRGGADAEPNLVPACAACNLSKHAKTLAEWSLTFGA
jgi:5-methylcytosine-specific restriction endonuclease McrA